MSIIEEDSDGVVASRVRIVPAKRTASYEVRLSSAAPGSSRYNGARLTANVNTKTITLGTSADIPKTLEAVDAIAALVAAIRAELVEQGIVE